MGRSLLASAGLEPWPSSSPLAQSIHVDYMAENESYYKSSALTKIGSVLFVTCPSQLLNYRGKFYAPLREG